MGDGSIPAPKWDRPVIPIIGRNRTDAEIEDDRPPPKSMQNPLLLFKHLDVVVLLVFTAVSYAVYYAVTTTIALLFQAHYTFLSESDTGLCFLAIGIGSALGSVGVGKTLDWDYHRIRRRREKQKNRDLEKTEDSPSTLRDDDFPIEEARFRLIPIYLGVFVACCVGYGWSIEKTAPLAVPLIIMFISA